MVKLKSYEDVLAFTDQQVTAQELINGQLWSRIRGWEDVELDDDFKERIIGEIVTILGGHLKTKLRICGVLRYSKPQHWGLSRIILRDTELCYIDGQDHTWEIKNIRDALKK
jgi:hypothetical protein